MADKFDVSLPVAGPIDKEAFFAARPIAEGLPPCLRMGLGTAWVAHRWQEGVKDDPIRVLHDAWANGFTFVDSAPNYTKWAGEEALGRALEEWSGAKPILFTKIDVLRPDEGEDWPTAIARQYEASQRLYGGRRIDGLAMHDAQRAPAAFVHACMDFLQSRLERGEIAVAGLGGCGPKMQIPWLRQAKLGYVLTHKRLGALSLQALTDTVPVAQLQGAKVIVGSAVGHVRDVLKRMDADESARTIKEVLKLRTQRLKRTIKNKLQRDHFRNEIRDTFAERALDVMALADEAGLSWSHLVLRFVLSMPMVDFMLVGSSRWATWTDCRAAYEAGPLPADLYGRVWRIAQDGREPMIGG